MKNKILLSVAAFAVGTQLFAQSNTIDNRYLTLSSGQINLGENRDNNYYRLATGVNKYFLSDYLLFGVEVGVSYAPDMHKSSVVKDKNIYELDSEFKLGGHIDMLNLDLYGLLGAGFMFYNEAELNKSTYTYNDVSTNASGFSVGVGAQWFYDEWFMVTASYKQGKMTPSDRDGDYDYDRFNVGVGVCW